MNKGKFRAYFGNWLGIVGLIIVGFGFTMGFILLLVDMSGGFHSPYAGLVIYGAMPALVMLGIISAGLGVLMSIAKRRKSGHDAPLPVVDLNESAVLRRFIIVNVLVLIFLSVSGLLCYRAYHFTESVQFCGEICHEVMKPEYTTYGNSPHANVSCSRCHIGPGAEWFVKAKLSGLYQVYSVIFNKYHRPVETPLENLRPARETCAECHWPKKFFGAVLRSWTYYLPDEKNSPWTVKMLLKVGGGDPAHGPVRGIHWHMNEENSIDYVSEDGKRIVIPWIRVSDSTGKVTIFRTEDKDEAVSDEDVASMPVKRMDCIDCHNRPTHHFFSPSKAMDQALSLGKIDKTIPNIVVNAIELLTPKYETSGEALEAIDKGLRDKYSERKDIDNLVTALQKIYSDNFFPEMRASWKEYPDHIGHKITPGCFRCHDGKHVSEDGRRLSNACDICHTIIAQGPGEDLKAISSEGLEFKHPEDIDDEWKTERCNTCHEGVPM